MNRKLMLLAEEGKEICFTNDLRPWTRKFGSIAKEI